MITLLIVFGITYALIASDKVDKTVAACLGAAVVILLGFIPYTDALHHVDLNVLFLLIGMMIIVNIMATTGVFEWIAIVIARTAKGNGMVIVILFMTVTAVLSALLDNVTTVILIAPITILIAQILEIPAVPLLIMESIFSNIGGTATLVGDPPNVLIGSQTSLSFNDFIVNLGPIVLIIMIVTLVLVYIFFRKNTKTREAARKRVMKAQPDKAIIEPKRLWLCLAVFSLVLVGFFAGRLLDVEPGIIALAGGLLMALVTRVNVTHMLEKVEWSTILFFTGLFMLVGALQENGVFTYMGRYIIDVTQGNLLFTALLILWVSAIASAVVDNIPLVIALIPLLHTVIPTYAESMGIAGNTELINAQIRDPLFWSLALGACLGGNGSLVGASANVVVSHIAKKNNYALSFWRFTKLGLPVMLLSIGMCSVYIYLRYFL